MRETQEETGLDVAVEFLVGLYTQRHKPDLVCVFACNVTGGELVAATDEVSAATYFRLDALPGQLPRPWVEHITVAAQGVQPAELRIVSTVAPAPEPRRA